MKIKTCPWIFTALCLLFAKPCVAAEEIHTLDEVVVQAQKEDSLGTTVRKVEIGNVARPVVSSIPDALDKTSGLDVRRRSTLTPKNSQVSIRGFDERRSLIMIDGRALNGTGVMGGYFVDWSALPAWQFETVEIGKGAFSAKYGNTLGGTIDMIPKAPPEKPEFSVFGGYKRFETIGTGASAAGKNGPFGVLLTAGHGETGGHLRNSEAERQDFHGRFYYYFGDDGKSFAGFRHIRGDFNMPVENREEISGFDSAYPVCSGHFLTGPGVKFPSGDRHGDGTYYNKKRYEFDFGIEKTIAGIEAEARIYNNIEDRFDSVRSYNLNETVLEREASPDRSWGWTLNFRKMTEFHAFGMGADANYQGYEGTEITYVREDYFKRNPTDGSDEKDATRRHGVYIDDEWTVSENLEIYLGLRYEDYLGDRVADAVGTYSNGKPGGFETIELVFDEETFLPKFGAVYRPVRGLALHGRVARATRFPDNPAFYWYYGGYRPEVDPASDVVRQPLTYEDAMEYEAGASHTAIPGWTFKLNGYHYRVDDYIRWVFGYAPSRVVYNIDRVVLEGLEFDAESAIFENVTAYANVTWQRTKKKGDVLDGSNTLTDELSELPEWKANLGVKYDRNDGLTAKIDVRWVDSRRVPWLSSREADTPDGTPVGQDVVLKDLDGFATADLFFKYQIWEKGCRGYLTLSAENLFDETYEEEYEIPAPGRVLGAGMEIRF